jgi:hypothetical protein
MTKKQKREWAINKAVSVLTCDNPIPMLGPMQKLAAKLDAMELADIGVIIASEYSPEGNARWQDLMGV